MSINGTNQPHKNSGPSQPPAPQLPDFSVETNEDSSVKHVVAVMSGKGGVGKSSVTSMLAVAMRRLGHKVAVLDADITGPSIAKTFGITGQAYGSEKGIIPLQSSTGIKVMSVNLLLENETDPVVWRGPILANTVKQFWSEVVWGDIDYMFIDMPPGTGDVPLTVFQSIRIDGIVVVTSPQQLVGMIVAKAVKMADMMNIPVIGVVENMSHFVCPDNDKIYQVFGESHTDEIAAQHDLRVLAKLPIDPDLARDCDNGTIENYVAGSFIELARKLQEQYR